MRYFCLYVSKSDYSDIKITPIGVPCEITEVPSMGYIYLIAVPCKNKLEELREARKIQIFYEPQNFLEKPIELESLLPMRGPRVSQTLSLGSDVHYIVAIIAEEIKIEKCP
jgi:hypothetical protein